MSEHGRPLPRRKARRGDVHIATIAELAGVSPPTVSKVLNGRSGVGEQTRQRVEALLQEHGYRRPSVSRATPALEVVFGSMVGSIAIEILRGVQQVAIERDCSVSFTDIRPHDRWLEPLLLRQPTGVIAVCPLLTGQHAELAASGVPMLALDPVGGLPVPAVGSNNWSGALTATRHLLELGHRRIAVITGAVEYLSARARLDGFRAALDHAGILFDENLERRGVFTFDGGRKPAQELLALPERPTAIVCGDDLQAMSVYEAARQAGLRIPDDLSVVGFDDIDLAAWLAPPLTTVRQPFAEMGVTAARLVLELADGKILEQDRYELGTTLVVRASTAPPRSF
ncbi:LacI family DNA-binding transcriptional regulator [Plantactinospora sp. CA-294935]|uniref:LacI family DNA-binding transcriptional regulator n=1 Tax=Plantactinospora sp. CA-294935 TaxID=3240012 RepID=UPI003D9230C7